MTLVAAYERLIGARGTEIKPGDPVPPSAVVPPVIEHPAAGRRPPQPPPTPPRRDARKRRRAGEAARKPRKRQHAPQTRTGTTSRRIRTPRAARS